MTDELSNWSLDDEELVTQWERRKRNATVMARAALRAFREASHE